MVAQKDRRLDPCDFTEPPQHPSAYLSEKRPSTPPGDATWYARRANTRKADGNKSWQGRAADRKARTLLGEASTVATLDTWWHCTERGVAIPLPGSISGTKTDVHPHACSQQLCP